MMGRYDGEDYDYDRIPICSPEQHDFAMNGHCWRCHRSRDSLLHQAERLIKQEKRLPPGPGRHRKES